MKAFFILIIVSLSLLTQDKYEQINLFDGKSLQGWIVPEGEDIKAVDGEIQIRTTKNVWLLHEGVFENFELEVELKMPEGKYNSGIGFRCIKDGKKPKGYQCEVADERTGSIYSIGQGWLHPTNKDWKSFVDAANKCFKSGEWNKVKIRAFGDHIQIWVNGHNTADVKDKAFTKGSIALQHHGKGGVHRFKNIKFTQL